MTTDADGGLTIVGFHGAIDPLYTPALHAPVFIDAEGEMVSPRTHQRLGVRISVDGELPEEGTRVGPWPAHGDEVVYGLSRTVAFNVQEYRVRKVRQLRDVPRRWLTWALAPSDKAVGNLRAQRIDAVRVLVASEEDIDALRELVAEWARERLLDVFHQKNSESIRQAAWTLQRSALSTDDVAKALVGLQRSGMAPNRVSRLHAELLPRTSPEERGRLLGDAAQVLNDSVRHAADGP